jgi:hypothetical protein
VTFGKTMKKILKVTCGLIVVAGLVVVAFLLRFPPDPLWFCQKAMGSGVEQYLQTAGTNAYPNLDGDSLRSFRLMAEYMAPAYAVERILADYAYVPGLTVDDPKDLVVFYLKKRTRKTWNGDHSASVFGKRRWMVIGPDFWWNGPNREWLPEGGQVLSTAEFRNRLSTTLAFLRQNQRPNWETVVKEQAAFLESLKE